MFPIDDNTLLLMSSGVYYATPEQVKQIAAELYNARFSAKVTACHAPGPLMRTELTYGKVSY